MRIVQTTSRFFLVLAVAACMATGNRAFAWNNYEGAFDDGHGHPTITSNALGFIGYADLQQIILANNDQDYSHSDDAKRHFTNCLFTSSAAYINGRYRAVIDALDIQRGAADAATALRAFGQLLHPIQDFYSHSVWSDPEGIDARGRLLESSLGEWSLPGPYKPLFKDVVIVEGNPPPGAMVDLRRDGNGKPTSAVPVVRRAMYTHSLDGFLVGVFGQFRGLMTASAFPFEGQMKCPPAERLLCPPDDKSPFCCRDDQSVCIRHGEAECARAFHDNCMHHDHEDYRPNRRQAFDAAVWQTRHEWCRLLHLAHARADGMAASYVMAVMIPMFGEPHPAGTPCAPEIERPPHLITVRILDAEITGARSLKEDPRYRFAIYKSSFRDSRRTRALRAEGLVLQMCANDADEAVATLWRSDLSLGSGTGRRAARATLPVSRLDDGVAQSVRDARFGMNVTFEFTRTRDGCAR